MNRKKLIKIFLIAILVINLFICLFGFLKKPIETYGFTSDYFVDDTQINLFIMISIILINILLIFFTINKLNKTKFIIIIIFFLFTFLMPVYEAYGTRSPSGPDSYLMGAIPVHKYYNVYGVGIYSEK